ncbi:trichohyalin isoform X3 [Spodoptera frugiperda]|uniref:Trichohyalin isoform X3 n=1 Tax=Spodoptera frugiperda TaxID=7108 RepID=A0A9R0E750_SPOFR|nr:trichohyalin isoform X3 [Spodoptera frugiperda]
MLYRNCKVMPRPRSNLSFMTVGAKRRRLARARESSTEREQRLARDRESHRVKRERESSLEREIRLRRQREYTRRVRRAKKASYAKAAQVRRTEESAPENKQRRSRNRKHNSQARARETSSERSQRLARQNVMRASRARAREISAERAQRLADLKRQHDSETRFRETSAQRSQRLATERQRATVTECYLMLKEVFRRRSRKPKLWTRAAAARRKNGKVVCPECNTDVDVEGRQGDKATAMLVNVYQYFATEGTKLSPSQLRERTALCTGASEEDVEHALGLYWSQTGDSDSQEAPSRKRRRVEEQPGDESHPLYVEVEVEAAEDEENGEEDPLTSEEEDIKPDITETCIQPVSQSSYIPVEDIKKETTEFEDGVS